MKRNFCIILALASFSYTCIAQGNTFGIKGGVNISNVYSVVGEKPNSKYGFVGGAFLDITIGTFVIRPEILISQKGWKYDLGSTYNYIEVPVILRYPLLKKYSLYSNFGPSISILGSAKMADIDISESINSIDYGLILGFDIALHSKISIDTRYNLGLRNIFKDVPSDLNAKHSTFSIMLDLHQ